jgi:uncharacterized protein YjbI with pentapeptide repeats
MKKILISLLLIGLSFSAVAQNANFEFVNTRGEVIGAAEGESKEHAFINFIAARKADNISPIMPVVLDSIYLDSYDFSQSVDLESIELGNVIFKNCIVSNSQFRNASLSLSVFENCRIYNNRFGRNLALFTISGGELIGNTFERGANVLNMKIVNVNKSINFRPVVAQGLIPEGFAQASRNIFLGARFENLVIVNSDLSNSVFNGAVLVNFISKNSTYDGSAFNGVRPDRLQKSGLNSCLDCNNSIF